MPIDGAVAVPVDEVHVSKEQDIDNSCVTQQDAELYYVDPSTQPRSTFFKTLFVVMMVLVMGWLLGTLFIALFGFAYNSTPVSVFVVRIFFKQLKKEFEFY